ncbi:MAG: adenylate/guanylate cyclase domain-containing protein [Motiliproteus sp.]|nr:adenylate/guanylate cyclase domain-containing protein [Motiliproteus sp.]MCW9052802.1 adenylate/guanylate cyclase domain-containing protein [Motiliproteus sp.]
MIFSLPSTNSFDPPRFRHDDFRRIVLIALASSLFGLLYSLIMSEGVKIGLLNGILNGVMIGLLDTIWIRKRRGRRLRQLPILSYVGVLTLLWTLLITINMVLTRHWLEMEHGFDLQWMRSEAFVRHFIFCFFMAFIFNFILRIISFLGSGSLLNILLGRYQEPAEKQIAFVFVDVVGSSRMTEQIGDTNTQKLIGELFFELAVIVERYGGEVHRYIGDEMVITWDLSDKQQMPDILACLAHIFDIVEQQKQCNYPRFGTWADVRAGINAGRVLVSEIGDLKRELVYFGDTINTAAALQVESKALEANALICSELYEQLKPSSHFSAKHLGEIVIKGKDKRINSTALTFSS